MATPHCTDEKFEKIFSEFERDERQRLRKRMQEVRKQKKQK